MQCIIDYNKSVLWVSYDNRGSWNSSIIFEHKDIYDLLQEKINQLFSMKYLTLGDSAYAIEPIIIPPYDAAGKCTLEDGFYVYQLIA